MTYTVTVPVTVPRTKKKSFALNLNIYRNSHFLVLNKAKESFKKLIWDDLLKLPTMTGVKLTYTLFMGTNREGDLANVCCVVDKFFCDALVEAKRLEDDSIKFITSIDYRFGGVDKGKPRVEITLEPTAIKEDNTMRIFLVQSEIELALRQYISEQLNVAEGMSFDIKLAATRGDEGMTAEINIIKDEKAVVEETQQHTDSPKRRGRRSNAEIAAEAAAAAQANENNVTNLNDVDTSEEAGVTEDPEADENTAVSEAEEVSEENVPAFLKKKSIFGN